MTVNVTFFPEHYTIYPTVTTSQTCDNIPPPPGMSINFTSSKQPVVVQSPALFIK